MSRKIWFNHPASEWMNGLPIGTGRLAAMVMGDPETERIALNHEWLWRATDRDRDTEGRSHLLPEVRDLLLTGDYENGTIKGNDAFGGAGGMSGQPNRVSPYQPAGDLFFRIDHGEPTDYRRELDLSSGLVSVTYEASGNRFQRHCVAHFAHDLLLIRLVAERPFGGEIWLDRTKDPECSISFETSPDLIVMAGEFIEGLQFRVEVEVRHRGGTLRCDGNRVVVSDASEIILAVNIGTSATGHEPLQECAKCRLPQSDWNDLLNSHAEAYAGHYGGLILEIEAEEPDLPTDERLAAALSGEMDPILPLLYFNLGRYLLLASTANGELPPNLQGKWNEDLNPPWDCDYHHDVNLQMNYWPAEAGHLQASTEVLFQHIERFVPHARKVARDLYDCDGVYFPLQTDPWGRATPESYGWAVWIGAAAWLAQHMWWHYEFGQDEQFLESRAYPFLKEVAAFYESYLLEDDDGVLQVVPSQSPENRFAGGGNLPVTLCVSATMDIQLIQDCLGHTIRASEILDVDDDRRIAWRSILERLPQAKIGSHGQLLEWNEDFEEVEPGHRHLSHLFGLFPGDLISPERNPALWQAARVSLERRLAEGCGQCGWTRAWASCLFARLGDADQAWEHLVHLITDFSTESLLDLHPPRIFQIEGNFGGTSAVLEMLLQSYHEELHFLPALPGAWSSGEVRGIRARGGYTINMNWTDGALVVAEVTRLKDGTCKIKAGDSRYEVRDAGGDDIPCTEVGSLIIFDVKAGETVSVRQVR
ncbi:MAG: glycoside hydrolase family 95 protein [Planctomycetota bacterium]|jgi:alpha-L-fucosidase 2|nr:glycoside hydrolase family 95 protein [Planctomycetota bacterium]